MYPIRPMIRRPLSSPGRVALLIGAVVFWAANIGLIINHQLAVERLPDTPPNIANDGVVYQTTDYSCGPACLATLFSQYNIIRSEREWAQLAGTNLALGTRLSGLQQAGDTFGFETVELNPSFTQLDLIMHPAIVFQSAEYHLTTFWGMDDAGMAIIRDPALGRISWGPADYIQNVIGNPKLLVFYPGTVPRCDPESAPVEIARFQNMLRSLGYFRGGITGRWSDRLANAIRSFQRSMDLEPTGVVDPATSIYLEGAWHVVVNGPVAPFMQIDRSDATASRTVPIMTRLNPGR